MNRKSFVDGDKQLHAKIVAFKKVAGETANEKFCGPLSEESNKLLVSADKIYKSIETINTKSCKDPTVMIVRTIPLGMHAGGLSNP